LLTADLVRARKKGRELTVVRLDDKARARAEVLAEELLGVVCAHVDRTRDELDEALSALSVSPRDCRLREGLKKLIDDRCEWGALEGGLSPADLRREVFVRAAEARRQLSEGGTFDRQAVLGEVAARLSMTSPDLERALYADLHGAQVLKAACKVRAPHLVDDYDLAQAQAVLLKAVKVVAIVRCAAPASYRALFHKLKFLRLLCAIRPQADGGYRIEIDGPYSLFESVTKYGLQLALLLPALRACDTWTLVADVRWGKQRERLTFSQEGKGDGSGQPALRLPSDVEALVQALGALESPWRVSVAQSLLHLPGLGLCVPDLVFEHRETGEVIYLEVMGYWSRDAVWKRVALVEQGLPERILFCVSERLRVSEAALAGDLQSALYVYKGTMNARAILRRVDELGHRAPMRR
jgi:predicted nuclease of restriction endonuclease-like RecB superfamily